MKNQTRTKTQRRSRHEPISLELKNEQDRERKSPRCFFSSRCPKLFLEVGVFAAQREGNFSCVLFPVLLFFDLVFCFVPRCFKTINQWTLRRLLRPIRSAPTSRSSSQNGAK
jgi:hypothetical protein